MSTQSTSNGGVGFFGLLFIVFLVLKLTHVIDWSWWWITAPLWCGFAFGIGFIILFLLGVILVGTYEYFRDKAKQKRIRN